MCIAIAKPMGVELPSKSVLKNCWDNNEDGAGFSFAHNEKVYIKKGFMDFDSFYNALTKMDKMLNLKNLGMLLHFRITTHGGTCPAMTHPFPIIDDYGSLSKLEYCSDYAVVHNGIISLTGAEAHKLNGVSDTAVFIKDYLSKISQNKNWLKKPCNMELIEKLIGSKMAFLDKYGNIKTTSGFTEDNGILWSNSTYKYSYYRTYKSKYSGSKYDRYWNERGVGEYESYLDDYGNNYYGDYDKYSTTSDSSKSVNKDTNDNITNYNRGLKGLMKIPNGYYIECGGLSEFVEESEKFVFLIDFEYNLYMVDKAEFEKSTYSCHYSYMGYADVYDNNLNFVDFKRDTWTYDSQLEDENDFPTEMV